jgi:hypothetical protein
MIAVLKLGEIRRYFEFRKPSDRLRPETAEAVRVELGEKTADRENADEKRTRLDGRIFTVGRTAPVRRKAPETGSAAVLVRVLGRGVAVFVGDFVGVALNVAERGGRLAVAGTVRARHVGVLAASLCGTGLRTEIALATLI